jgi:hypothetical protein
MLRTFARAGMLFVAVCLLPAAGCSSLSSSVADCCEYGCLDTGRCDTSKYCRHCCGTCCYSNKVHTIYDPCCRSCFGVPYSGGACTCMDDVKDRVNQISDIVLP